MEDPHFGPSQLRNFLTDDYVATRPLMPNLVFVRLAGTRPRIGEIVTPGVYFLPFLLSDGLAHLRRSHRLS